MRGISWYDHEKTKEGTNMLTQQRSQLPHDIEAEQRTLGGIIFDPETIDLVVDFLKLDDFHLEKHRLIYGAMLYRYVRREPMDCIILCDDLENAGELEQVGGASYVTTLAHCAPTDNTVEHYGRIVRKNAQYRELIWVGTKIGKIGYSDKKDAVSKAQDLISLFVRSLTMRAAS
jgi:replicative DNA helicase